MPIPSHLAHKLQQTLGSDASEALVSWMEDVDTRRGDIAELRHEMELRFERLEKLIESLRTDMMKWSFVMSAVLAAVVIVATARR